MTNALTCRTILRHAKSISWDGWLYMPSDKQWSLDTEVLLLPSEEVAPEDEDKPYPGIPPLALSQGLESVMNFRMADIVDFVRFARHDFSQFGLRSSLGKVRRHREPGPEPGKQG